MPTRLEKYWAESGRGDGKTIWRRKACSHIGDPVGKTMEKHNTNNDNNNNGRMAVFNVAGYLIEERRRWPILNDASPRGQCYK